MTPKPRITRITRLDVTIHNEHTSIGTLVSPTPADHIRLMTIEHAALAPGHHAERIEVYGSPEIIFDQILLHNILDYIKGLEPPPFGDVFWKPYVQEDVS